MNTNMITGLASGLDTESLVKSMVATHQSRVDSVKQKKEYAVWQQEAYRDIISDLKSFQSQFLDYTKTENCLFSSNTFNAYKAEATSTAVSVSTTGSATAGTHTISNITLAQKDTWKGTNIASLVGSGLNVGAINAGEKIDIELDGVKKTLTLSGGYADIDGLVSDLQTKINTEFGAGKITIGKSGGEVSLEAIGHVVRMSNTGDGDTTLTSMGFNSGDQNVLNINKSLGDANFTNDIFEAETTLSFSINGETFTFDKSSDTVKDMINEVNSNKNANVTMSYSEVSNSFVLEADEEGVSNQISFQDITGSFFSVGMGIDEVANTGHTQVGSDASFTLDEVVTTRSTNSFTIDGIKYTLNENTGDSIKVSVETDTSEVKSVIETFVEKYNEMINKFNGLVNEKRDYDYDPLTQEQKDAMSDEEIEIWEEKAKQGILGGDDTLRKTMSDMRNALTSIESDLGISLYDLGITTSKNFRDGGQLIINEDKLNDALENRMEDVKNLFTDNEKGIAAKLQNVMDYAIKPTGAQKGAFLIRAGLEGTTTENDNILSDRIEDYDDRIAVLLDRLDSAEEMYYAKFAAMEQALQKMNSQSSWISSQLGM